MNSLLCNKNYYFTFLLLILSITGYAQTGSIKGIVKTADGQPAAAITVGLSGTSKGAITDDKGAYQLSKVKPGTYTIKLSAIGLVSLEQSVTVASGETTTIDFTLNQDAKQLSEVVINTNRRLKFGDKKSDMVARMPLANLENPQVYSVIPSTLLKEQNITDYKSALRNASGTTTLAQAGNGRSYTFMRGFITGNFVRNGLVAPQYSAIDPANIDRIEVIKGPSGTLFSSSVISYGGLINRVTKKPVDSAFTEVAYTGGSFGLNRITADVNVPLNDSKTVLLRLNGAYHREGSFQDAGFERNYFVNPSLTYKVNSKLNFNVEAELYQRHTGSINGFSLDNEYWAGKSLKDLPVDYLRSYQGNDIDTKLTNYNFYVQANYQISNSWKSQTLFTLNGVYAPHQLFLNKTITSATEMERNVGVLSDKYHQTEIQQNFNGDVHTGNIRHRLLVGFDFVAYRQDPYYYAGTAFDKINYTQPGNFFVNTAAINRALDTLAKPASDQNTYNSAAYFADVVNLTDRLNVLLSIRVDHYKDKGFHDITSNTYDGAFSQTSWSPKFGAVYQLIKGQLSAFGNYMNGFNYTNAKDENGKLFKPEQAFQYEGGLKLETADNKLSATLSYYNILVKDKLRTNPANTNFSIQDATQRSRGLEAEVVANPIPGFNILLGYGYNDNIYTKSDAEIQGKRPYGTPAHLVNTWLSYAIQNGSLKGFGLGAGGNYASKSFVDDTDLVTVPSYIVLNSTIFYNAPKYRVGFGLDNITNEHYWGPFVIPQRTRSFSANVSYRF